MKTIVIECDDLLEPVVRGLLAQVGEGVSIVENPVANAKPVKGRPYARTGRKKTQDIFRQFYEWKDHDGRDNFTVLLSYSAVETRCLVKAMGFKWVPDHKSWELHKVPDGAREEVRGKLLAAGVAELEQLNR